MDLVEHGGRAVASAPGARREKVRRAESFIVIANQGVGQQKVMGSSLESGSFWHIIKELGR